MEQCNAKEREQGNRIALVSGAAGYIGIHVVRALSESGFRVWGLDRDISRLDGLCERTIQANLFDPDFSFEDFCSEIPDVCLHLAWRNGFNHMADTHIEDLPHHFQFLDKAITFGIPQIAVMGTMHEVGYFEGMISESTPCNPMNYYAVAKDALRRALFVRTKNETTCLQWLRAYYITGDDERSQSVFGKLYRAAKSGEPSFPLNSGKNQYDFIDIDDLAFQIAACVSQKEVDGIIECCTGTPKSLKEALERFVEDNDLEIELKYGLYPDRPYDSPGIWGDNSKIKKILSGLAENQGNV